MRRVRLELFGGFQLLAESGAPIPVTAKKVRTLAAYLALLRGQWRSRDALAALLWDDSAPAPFATPSSWRSSRAPSPCRGASS